MAAKLKWYRGWLRLGKLALARVVTDDALRHCYRLSVPASFSGDPRSLMSKLYERLDDAKRDAESEVRRLLKAAGVEVS